MTKIVWHSNAPWAGTGYGQQTALVTPLLRDAGHDVAISAFWGLGGKKLQWDGLDVYPADEVWGNEFLAAYAYDHGGGDLSDVLVLTLMDVWVLTGGVFNSLNLAAWCPVDHDPAPPRVIDFFKRTGATPIAMSLFGKEKFEEAGIEPLYAPHAVDTETFKPTDGTPWREAIGIGPDTFVVGMVAANKGNSPPRKAFPQVFEAFAELHKRHPDSLLYLHTIESNIQSGIDLRSLASVTGVPQDALKFTPKMALQLGIDPHEMSLLYSMFDVLCSPSYGEGFGIPIIEAQACGVPVIVNDFTAMHELAGPAQWLTTGERWYDMSQGAWFQSPHVSAILDRLEEAYERRDDQQLKADCREFALRYDTRRVFQEHWQPTIAALETKMAERRRDAPMPPVKLNRETRRELARKKQAA